ncbi:MAG: twin-arginine translocase TatA/TatE family subunit [Desulfatiglandales bacterium]
MGRGLSKGIKNFKEETKAQEEEE